MKTNLVLSLTLLFLGMLARADEPEARHSEHDAAKDKSVPSTHHHPSDSSDGVDATQMFLVTVAAYEIEMQDDLEGIKSPDKLLEFIERNQLRPIETLRTTVVAGKQSMIQFAKRVQRVTGTIVRNDNAGPSRAPQSFQQRTEINIGTMLQITVNAQGEKIWLT